MTAIHSLPSEQAFPAEILELQANVTQNPEDLVARITLASALEEAGFLSEAALQYQAIQSLDTDQIFTATAEKAIAGINAKLGEAPSASPRRSYRQGNVGNKAHPFQANETDVVFTAPNTEVERFYPDEILALQTAAAENPTDLVAKITLANALEQAGFLSDAVLLYQQIKALDDEGVFSGTADKALADLQIKLDRLAEEKQVRRSYRQGRIDSGSEEELAALESQYDEMIAKGQQSTPLNLVQSIKNLPIASKQFVAFLSCSTISVVAVVGAGMAIALLAGRTQLRSQAGAELAVTQGNYAIKINQMGFGFRGQSDNPAIIAAAQLYSQGKPVPDYLQKQIKTILKNEVTSRVIEYATLVGPDKKIIVNANTDRQGQTFDPDNLVSSVFKNPFSRQLKASTIVDAKEVEKESPPMLPEFTKQNNLIRYTITPVRDPDTRQMLAVLVSGDIVNGKDPIVKGTIEAFDGGYSAVYFARPNGQLALATSMLSEPAHKANDSPQLFKNIPLPDLSLVKQAQKGIGNNITGRLKIHNQYMTVAVKAIPDADGKPIAFLVRGTPETNLDTLLKETFLLQLGVGALTLIFSALVALVLSRALTKPLKQLQVIAQRLGSGEVGIRANIQSEDEVGQLASAFNDMADRVETYTQSIQETARQRQQEAESQRQQKEELQQGVIRLLLDIEEASKGDLTVKSQVETGAVGSIADAFNATIAGLRHLVEEVSRSAGQVNKRAQRNSKSVIALSYKAIAQAKAIESATQSVAEMAQSIESVSDTAQNAAAIARQGNEAAQQGQETMDQTVNSIYKIRGRVAEISKKSKRLAESSQEISKIVNIIAGISEKTNLLAFNASIEAARAGENGQGFRIVADEVRRLAEMVTVSAQEIEQVILRIQEETAEMTKMMEESTSEVVTGTQLVQNTKETLQNLTQISQEIDSLLALISSNTESQRLTSKTVTETMQKIAKVSKDSSNRSQSVSESLQDLVNIALELQNSASRFKVE
ncbi:MAG: methyl-accepting chemotaxis protein [Snowella sp.]|nr:methyl-accepting chemotaxis protein [Snowella sp.]